MESLEASLHYYIKPGRKCRSGFKLKIKKKKGKTKEGKKKKNIHMCVLTAAAKKAAIKRGNY